MSDWMTMCAATAMAGVGGTGLGGVVSCGWHQGVQKRLEPLLGFAAGVMLGVVCFGLLQEALQSQMPGGTVTVLGLCLCGYGATGVVGAWLATYTTGQSGWMMALAIALHNFPEGMVLGASFLLGDSTWEGVALMVLAIAVHNVPEGMAVSGAYLANGMQPRKALALTALAGLPTVLGAMVGYGVGALGTQGMGASLCLAAGAMLYVIFMELLPNAQQIRPNLSTGLAAAVGLLLGIWLV